MAELGGMLAAAILKVVGDQIGSAIGGQITLQKNFDADLKKMKMALESVEAVLKAAERRSITDEPTRLWLKRLTDAMYDISSMIDEFEDDTHAITQPSTRKLPLKKHLLRWVCCLPIGPRITMANEMQMMRDELKEITDNHHNFTLGDSGTSSIQLTVVQVRETSAFMGDKGHVVGREDETEKILASLSESMGEEFIVLPIYGIRGLGKTTLAKIVFSNSHFRGYSQVWIYVSETFDLKKIGNAIITQLSKEKSQHTEMQMIYNSLRELLANNKILIVLDDLWEEKKSHLDELMNMLKVGESGNVVVIVTTRSEDITKKIYTIKPHKLASLTDEMCWTIIKKKSDFESRDDQEELRQIGETIASKCGGVALAAQTLGHMLHSLSFGEWESVGNSDIWNLSDLEDTSLTHVIASLSLSYSVLPSNLKLCFAFCAIFPKGYKIGKDDLIRQWISLGFIKATNMLSTWQLGEKYIRQLVGLSFLAHSKSELTTGVNFENDTFFTMHDLVHDVARSVMVGEILVPSKKDSGRGNCCHFALLDDCSKPLESSKIRALRFMECGEVELNGSAFSSSKSMRVLDLNECSIHKLPDSIGELKHLRYLNAPRVQDAIITTSITRLSKLIYLSLHGSSRILGLPELFGAIEGLAYLDLSGCLAIEKLPESFGRLKELVHLDLSNCSSVGGISVFLEGLRQLQYLNLSHCPNIGELPDALGGLSKLQYLNLSFNSYLKSCKEAEVLGALTKLEYLNLSSECCDLQKLPEAFGNFFQLKYLNLSGCRHIQEFPRSFGNLKSLVHLDLSNCYMVCGVPEVLGGLISLQYLNLSLSRYERIFKGPKAQLEVISNLTKLRYLNLSGFIKFVSGFFDRENVGAYFMNRVCTLPNVEHLDLSHNDSIRFLPESLGNLRKLHTLDVSDNRSIKFLPESLGNLRKLHTLDVSHCPNLRKIPESIGTIGSLKFLFMNGCHWLCEIPRLGGSSISLPHFVVHAGDGESSSNLVLLQHTDPPKLEISRLENVMSAEEVEGIKLMEKQSLGDLKLNWTRDVERFVDDKMVLEKLVPPSRLKKLEIRGYSGVSLPGWVVGQLPNLEIMVLIDMPNLEEWIPSYSSGEKHVIERLEIHDCPMLRMKPLLARASRWLISNSDNVLSSWEECTVSHTNASSSSPVTTELSVMNCQVPLHQWRLLQHLPGLPYLSIANCADLTSSPKEIIQNLSSVKRLRLEDRGLEELPKWMGELITLQDLVLSNCERLKGLHENMRQLTELQSLELVRCNSMASLPHWLDELTSLKGLRIYGNPLLRSLPKSMQQLTGLQKLGIIDCGQIKLFHGKERVCVLPTSLEVLEIERCPGITSLPEGILTNLHTLSIGSGPELKWWCFLEENKTKLAHIKNMRLFV